jgi:hypothetical protein
MITMGIDPHKSSLTAGAVNATGQAVAEIQLAVTATAVGQLVGPPPFLALVLTRAGSKAHCQWRADGVDRCDGMGRRAGRVARRW